jgi:hypothetical protein
MELKKHAKGVIDVESWQQHCPPKKGDLQWRDGRSAKELAKYITESLPAVPAEIESVLKTIVPMDATFDWDAEYVTPLPGKGEGRNHDGILYGDDIVVTIEAKADETLGNLIEEEMNTASVNKLYRISKMLGYLFDGGFKKYSKLRYQLLTASVGTIIEAERRKADCKELDTAVLFVLVFKTNGDISEEKLISNHKDIENFLEATKAYDEDGFKVIPNNTGIKLYFKEIIL